MEFSESGNDHLGSANTFHDTEGPIIKSEIEEGNGFEFPSTTQKINLQEFLEENGETPTNRFIFGGNREGASCTTPTGRLYSVSLSWVVINFIKYGIFFILNC